MIATGIGILAFFYLVYFGKMLLQKKKGIQTDQLAKQQEKSLSFYFEVVLKGLTYGVVIVELISIFAVQDYLPMPVVILGAVFGILGDLIFAAAVFTMKDSWRAGLANGDDRVVTNGIYQYSRNPAFLGFDLVYIGIVLMFFNWILFGVSAAAMLLLHIQILREEKYLTKLHGEEYLKYKRRVNRYVGWKSWQINEAVKETYENESMTWDDTYFRPANVAAVTPVPMASSIPPVQQVQQTQQVQQAQQIQPTPSEQIQQPGQGILSVKQEPSDIPEKNETQSTEDPSEGDFSVNEMLAMQRRLQNKYNENWEPIGPEAGRHKLLWMIGEIGEVIDVVKKNGGHKACGDEELRKVLVEEMADVLMYYNDVLLCYNISAGELKQVYMDKFEKNMERW